ncbi:MAG: hypothetical protein RXN90_09690 [Thermoproteus sp.]
MSNVLWEADGKYVPVSFHASFYYNQAELFIVEKIVLIDDGGDDYKRIKLIGRKVSFNDNGAVVARAGSIVVGSVEIATPVGYSGKIWICGYVAENESLKQQASYGDLVIRNVKATDYPCSQYPGKDFIDCIMNYYAELLNMGVDIEDVHKEYIPWEELESAVCALMLASIKEKLLDSMKRQDNPYIRSIYDSLATSCNNT